MEYLLLVIAGLLGGFLAGLLGVGGGVIFVFVLTIFFEKAQLSASELPRFLISNSIFATFFAGLSSSIKNRKLNSFHFKEVLYCSIPGSISALIVTYLITNFTWYNKQEFTIFFVVLIIFFFVRLIRKRKSIEEVPEKSSVRSIVLIGVFSGIVSALSGLGGGVIMVPLLTQILKMPMKKAASISLGVIPFFALSMSIFYGLSYSPSSNFDFSVGYLVFPAAVPLAFGVIIAAPIGVKVAQKLPNPVIKVMFASLLLLVALKMIFGYFN